jgi:hypothetical protein
MPVTHAWDREYIYNITHPPHCVPSSLLCQPQQPTLPSFLYCKKNRPNYPLSPGPRERKAVVYLFFFHGYTLVGSLKTMCMLHFFFIISLSLLPFLFSLPSSSFSSLHSSLSLHHFLFSPFQSCHLHLTQYILAIIVNNNNDRIPSLIHLFQLELRWQKRMQ